MLVKRLVGWALQHFTACLNSRATFACFTYGNFWANTALKLKMGGHQRLNDRFSSTKDRILLDVGRALGEQRNRNHSSNEVGQPCSVRTVDLGSKSYSNSAVAGTDLSNITRRRDRIGVSSVSFAIQLAQLEQLHKAKIIHADVKPDNLR
uniref:Protein kinase domain-containing protein n=1 Tax=Ditylenchus dipsaci TaxID=166011 RepID=A0A915EK12_9BILA